MNIRDYKVKQSYCPNCNRELDGALSLSGRKPKPGSVSICIDCSHISMFDDNLQLRNLTDDEMVEVAGDPNIIKAMIALETFHKMRKQ